MPSNLELFETLKFFEWLTHKKFFFEHVKDSPIGDAARGRGRILATLSREDGISTKELSNRLGIGVSSLNELLAKLEESGHIARKPKPEDRRVIIITLTELGREAAPNESTFSCFDALDAEEKQKLFYYITRVNDRLEEELSSYGNEVFEKACRDRKEALDRFLTRQNGKESGPPSPL